jgi:imidazolonepropionase-like amidohydrolase
MMGAMRACLAAFAIVLLGACGKRAESPPAPPPASGAVAKATLAITNVRVFDGERVLTGVDVAIDGATIVAVGPKLVLPAGVETVDGAGKTLVPGLFDAHVHVFDAAQLRQSLAYGVTTVLDMFSLADVMKDLKAADAPDRAAIRSAGTLATAPGGHGTEYGFEIPTLTAADQAPAWVDARIAEGSDYIKIVYDDGHGYNRPQPTLDTATLAAVIAAAHARGKLAVVHIADRDAARTAIESGADGLIHLFQDAAPASDFGALVAGKHAFITPTLTVMRALAGDKSALADDARLAPYLSVADKANLVAQFPAKATVATGAVTETIAQLRAAKVRILCGTDAPNAGTTFGASVHEELALLVAAGLTPVEALTAATSAPATQFGLTDRGRIAAGARADLVLVDGDPTTTITDTRAITAIWRGGVRFDRAAYKAELDKAAAAAGAPVEPGVISAFDDGTLAVRFGAAWVTSTDAMIGGTSAATLAVEDGALAITGTVATGKAAATWAGAMFSPGAQPFAPADLSKAGGIAFRAKGDGKDHVVLVFAQRLGRMPAAKTFTTDADFAPVAFRWKDFGDLDGSDITGIFIGHVEPGPFSLVVDDVAVR